jgi:hypothetical protein
MTIVVTICVLKSANLNWHQTHAKRPANLLRVRIPPGATDLIDDSSARDRLLRLATAHSE